MTNEPLRRSKGNTQAKTPPFHYRLRLMCRDLEIPPTMLFLISTTQVSAQMLRLFL